MIILVLAIIVIGIITGVYIYNRNKKIGKNIVDNEINIVSETITDECTEEYGKLEEQAKLEIETNSSEEKISPNCLITLKDIMMNVNIQ